MMATGKATGTNSFIIEITNPSAYAYIFPLSEVQLKIVTKYKDSYIVVRDIFGINYAKKVFEKSGDIE